MKYEEDFERRKGKERMKEKRNLEFSLLLCCLATTFHKMSNEKKYDEDYRQRCWEEERVGDKMKSIVTQKTRTTFIC